MDNIFGFGDEENDQQTQTDTAIIREVGYNSPDFGTPKAGELIGQEVELLYLYPVDGIKKTTLGHDHAIVQFEDKAASSLLIDCNLEIKAGGN